ncbi:MAG TPA: hypothetical protein VN800_05110 [Candidatus Acidoferrales bacterium]|nr:hypothetical protein [Candidatus Acidoferrales bacterium]
MAGLAIGESLAYINWTVLGALAVGSFAAVVLLGLRTDATRGFLGFTAFCSAALAGLTLLADTALPDPGSTLTIAAAPDLDLPRRAALAALAVLALAYVVALARNRRAPVVGIAGVVAGVAALAIAADGWGGGPARGIPLAVQLLALAAALGGVLAAMILGHWYLVTPRLSEGPLVLLARVLTWVVGAQLALFVAWMSTGAGASHPPFEPLVGAWALFVWLRLLIGLVFPVAVTWGALQTARSRSMESATGLLYVDVGAIAAGTILAAGLYFGAGLLV